MKLLITGGAGFIGSHLAERLLRQGHTLAIVDDLNDSYSPYAKLENLEAIRAAGPISFHVCDIRDSGQINRIIQEERPQAVLHFAARVGARQSLLNPRLYESVNVGGTLALLEACRRFRLRKFLFASSNAVYGMSARPPFHEEDSPSLPISPYAVTKLAGERLCYAYSHLYGIQTVCLRLFTVYGPRQRPDMAVRRFIELIDQGRAIQVFGDGTYERDFTYVDDAIQGVLEALTQDCQFDIFNLGYAQKVSVRQLIECIERQLGRIANIEWRSQQPGDLPLAVADITKATTVLGYRPVICLEEGIRRLTEWCQDHGRRNR